MKISKACILLTGSIKPENVFSLKRSDTAIRENDYYLAITKWLRFGIPVVFCENSNYNSGRISSISDENFEFLQYKESSDLSKRGKGYGEYQIMKYAHNHSRFINEREYIIKVTGRLFIKNFRKLLNHTELLDFDIMAPLENNLKWSDSRIIFYHKDFFKDYFMRFAEKIDDSSGIPFERALAFGIHSLLSDNGKWFMPPVYPKYAGYSGTHDKRYSGLYKLSFLKQIRFPILSRLIKK